MDGKRFERSARFWLRVYPPRWRELHEDEVIGVLEELAPDGARRVGTGAVLDLVRAGLTYRVRGRPDPLSWVLYRFFDLPIRGFIGWVADDIDGRWFLLRRLASVWFGAVISVVAVMVDPDHDASKLVAGVTFVVIMVSGAQFIARPTRAQARRRHLLDEPPPPPGPFHQHFA